MWFRAVDYLKELRDRLAKHEITHAELAREIEMDTGQFSRLINGVNAPGIKTVERVEKGLARMLKRREKRGE